jgi:hypothetical protein
MRLYVVLLLSVVIGFVIRAKYNHPANKIECVAATPKAPL